VKGSEGNGLSRLRKNSAPGEKDAPEAKAHDDYMTFMPGINPRHTLKEGFPQPVKPDVFSIVYGKTRVVP
jgi:hypothetical protein